MNDIEYRYVSPFSSLSESVPHDRKTNQPKKYEKQPQTTMRICEDRIYKYLRLKRRSTLFYW